MVNKSKRFNIIAKSIRITFYARNKFVALQNLLAILISSLDNIEPMGTIDALQAK